jgi:hypothetical protein
MADYMQCTFFTNVPYSPTGSVGDLVFNCHEEEAQFKDFPHSIALIHGLLFSSPLPVLFLPPFDGSSGAVL